MLFFDKGGGTEVKLESDEEDAPAEEKKESPAPTLTMDEPVPEITPLSAEEERPKLDVSQTTISAPARVAATRTSSKGSKDEDKVCC